MVPQALPVLWVPRARRAPLALREHRAHRVYQEHRAHKACLALRGLQEPWGHKEPRDLKASKGLSDRLGLWVLRVLPDPPPRSSRRVGKSLGMSSPGVR